MGFRSVVGVLATLGLSSSALTIAQTTPAAPVCEAFSISCPITGGCTGVVRSSPFGPRTHPVTGQLGKMHWGTDFAVPTKTSIVSSSNGVVERSKLDATGFGNYIVIRHDNGSATLYAHLDTRLVQVGNRVTAGQQIGLSDGEAGNAGRGTSTGAHLHFEYIRSGEIVQSPARINPDACIGNTVNGSIRVFDNGNLADDAFRVTLDGVVLGETAIGLPNTFAANNLATGRHTLVVTTIVAPDDVGTYQIELANGIKFEDGTVSKSGTTAAAGSVSFVIVVPVSVP